MAIGRGNLGHCDGAKINIIRLKLRAANPPAAAQQAINRYLEAIQARLSAIVTEARSPDPWTSRARPSFLYVMYVMLLWAIPMGVLAALLYEWLAVNREVIFARD